MNITKETLSKWAKLKSHGDGAKIAEANPGINVMDISRAFKLGRCSDEVYEAIEKYYREKSGTVIPEAMVKAAPKMLEALQAVWNAKLVKDDSPIGAMVKAAIRAAKG